MTLDLFSALVIFAAISAYTPGPNNTLLMASGINFGYRRTLPLVLGVCIGFPLMIACVGLGLGKIFAAFPLIYTVLKYAGAAYMVWLAWKIASSAPTSNQKTKVSYPMTFLQGAAFQWVNPKGWVMAVTSLSTYTVAAQYYTGVAAITAVYVVMGFTSASAWALFGMALKQVMSDPRWFRFINGILALLLVASLIPMLWH